MILTLIARPWNGATAPVPTLSPRLELVAIAVLTLGFGALTAPLLDGNRPLGTDWMAYLKNAVALAQGDYDLYQRWRGPLHAWVCVGLTPLFGGLTEASQALSLACATACIGMTWWLGRVFAGPYAGLTAAGLLAGWADLRLHAISSTPYPLLAALTLLGVVLLVASRQRASLAIPAGITFALAILTDLRAGPTTALLLLACLAELPANPQRKRRLATWAIVAALAFGASRVVLALLPFELVPLSEQIALQRDLNAREGMTACAPHGPALPSPQDLFGACGQTNFRANLTRGQGASPVDLAVVGALLLLGLAAVRRWPDRALVLLPLLPTVPSMLVVGIQPRYLVPLAPFVCVATGAALAAWTRSRGPRAGPIVLTGLVFALGAGWVSWPGTLWVRANGQGDIDPALALHGPAGYVQVRAALRERLEPEDRVVDCARAGLAVRLYPHPVDTEAPGGPGRLSKSCSQLLAGSQRNARATWVLVVAGPTDTISPVWETVYRAPDGGTGEVRLLRRAPADAG